MRRSRKFYSLRITLIVLLLFICGRASGIRTQDQPLTWKFAVVADTQGNRKSDAEKPFINEEILTMIAADIVREGPAFVLVAGDLVNGWLNKGDETDYGAQFAAWKQVMRPVYEAGIRIYPVRGNHEDGPERFALPPLPAKLEPPEGSQAALKAAFKQAFNQEYIPQNGPAGEEGLTYSFGFKNARIIGLDEYVLHQHKVNQTWLDEQISSKTEAHLFVYGHEPAFGVHHKDNLSFYDEDRDLLWNAIGRGGGGVYFCGHDHIYNRAAIADDLGNPIRQIIVGSGGGKLRTWSGEYTAGEGVTGEYHMENLHGYVIVMVDGPRVSIQWRAITDNEAGDTWQVLDTFSYDLGSF